MEKFFHILLFKSLTEGFEEKKKRDSTVVHRNKTIGFDVRDAINEWMSLTFLDLCRILIEKFYTHFKDQRKIFI